MRLPSGPPEGPVAPGDNMPGASREPDAPLNKAGDKVKALAKRYEKKKIKTTLGKKSYDIFEITQVVNGYFK